MVTGSCTSVRESWQNNCNKTYKKIKYDIIFLKRINNIDNFSK